MNALVVIEPEVLTPAVFAQPGGIDAMLAKVEADVNAIVLDISTPEGRKEIGRLDRKIASSKTAFDKMGKDLVAGWKDQAKVVDVERRRVWDRLEALQAKVTAPLEEYKAAEAKRIAEHQNEVQTIIDLGSFSADMPASADVIAALTALEALPDRDWQEFKQKAATARSETFAKLQALKSAALAREAEVAELARLRAEQVQREQRERDERIAAEAATKAKEAAEALAAAEAKCVADETAERERKAEQDKAAALAVADKARRDAEEATANAERDRLAAIKAAEDAAAKAEQDRLAAAAATKEAEDRAARERLAAAEKAETDRLAAIDAERQRVADEAAAEAAATAKREADKAHKRAINKEAKAALVAAGLSDADAETAIKAIALGTVPHVKISY